MPKYGLKFERKDEACEELLKTHHVYLSDDKRSFVRDESRHQNFLIEGENLHALKILSYTHAGKVDCIAIDPPYNTGNKDFVYNDVFVDEEDSFRHSKWLSFMEKRLKIARTLLSERGVIFISIDDNEQANLKLLCDEVFGERNKLACITVINNLKGRSDADNFAPCHEYLLVYSKQYQKGLIRGRVLTDEESAEYSLKDEISAYKLIQLKKTGSADKREDRPNMHYKIYYHPTTGEISLKPIVGGITIIPLRADGTDGRWSWGSDTFLDNVKTEVVVKFSNGKYNVYQKMRDISGEGEVRTRKHKTVWMEPSYSTTTSADEIKKIFGEKSMFDFAKSISFVKDVIRSATNKDSIVLDFFAGSGTTGQAVAELNKEDSGTRQFILVTNNDKSEKLPDGICAQVTFPRLEKTIGNENLKVFQVKQLKMKGSNVSNIEQLELNNRLLPTMCLANNTFVQVEKTKQSAIFTDHKKKLHLGVWSNTDDVQKSPVRKELTRFEKRLTKMSKKTKLLVNRPNRGFAREYYEFMK